MMVVKNRILRFLHLQFPVNIIRNNSSALASVEEKYNQPEEINFHSQSVKEGLEEWEQEFLGKFMQKRGSLLDIGCGAGREAIAFAKLGFEVTAIDISPGMIEVAKENAGREKVGINFALKSASEIDYPDSSFDYVILSRAIYSYLPTRQLRIRVLGDIKRVLKPSGLAIFSAYYYRKRRWFSRTYALDLFRRFMRVLLGDKFKTEPGDTLFKVVSAASMPEKLCFGHYFSCPREILDEIKAAGLKPIEPEKTDFWVVSRQ